MSKIPNAIDSTQQSYIYQRGGMVDHRPPVEPGSSHYWPPSPSHRLPLIAGCLSEAFDRPCNEDATKPWRGPVRLDDHFSLSFRLCHRWSQHPRQESEWS